MSWSREPCKARICLGNGLDFPVSGSLAPSPPLSRDDESYLLLPVVRSGLLPAGFGRLELVGLVRLK